MGMAQGPLYVVCGERGSFLLQAMVAKFLDFPRGWNKEPPPPGLAFSAMQQGGWQQHGRREWGLLSTSEVRVLPGSGREKFYLCVKIFNLGSLAPHGLAVEETCLTCQRLLSSFPPPHVTKRTRNLKRSCLKGGENSLKD